jgi:AAA domain
MNIVPANKANKKLRIALFGDSGHGKSHTAINMAKACGDRVLVIDSEDGASHSFSDMASFSVLRIDEPTIEKYIAALELAYRSQKDFDAVIIDSLSHAWQNALAQVSTQNNTQLGWGKVTPKWDSLIHKIKLLDTHVIVTMRQKDRKDGNNWVPTYDSRENSDYDFDLILQMTGLTTESGATVAKAVVKKNRFNTQVQKLSVGGTVNAGASLIKFILDWQRTNPDAAAAAGG